ncbi:MAG: hypothetical protein ACLGH0_10125, partial [Thermoanaerobaculia bacterium]
RATTVGGNVSEVTSTFEVVSGIELFNAPSTINVNDTGFDDTTYIVKGSNAVLTIIGPRKLKNLVILDGGKVIHRQTTTTKADALEVQRLYIACGGSLNVDFLGLAKSVTVPGAGLASQSSGGSYIGRGGLWSDSNGTGQPGTTYGSVTRPELPGSGGYVGDATFDGGQGGGVVRVLASTSVTIDGTITARGRISSVWGSGSGGAVWITTPGLLAGGGSINTRGGGDGSALGAGGGGPVSLEYGSLSGELAKNIDTSGGRPNTASANGASGSLFLRATDTLGELVIDNRAGGTTATTELPSFGIATVASVSGDNVTLQGPSYTGTWFKGHSVRVTAPDGTVRGTTTIANVTNDASVRVADYFAYIKTQDSVAYDGYIVYAENGRDVYGTGAVKFFAARNNGGQWQYDTDSAFLNFTPAPGEAIVAAFRKAAYGIVTVTPATCPCNAINGMPVLALISGELLINASPHLYGPNNFNLWSPDFNAHEFLLRQGAQYGVSVGAGGATLELEPGVAVQPGDTLRGVYQLDRLTVRAGRIVVQDLVESVDPAIVAAGAT